MKQKLWIMLMIAVLIAALCCGMAGAETVNASLDDLAILQKSKKSELDSFSYTYSVDGQTITVNTANLPEEWSNIKAIYSFYDSHEERSFKEEIELSSSDRQNWTGEIPSYVIEENGEFYAISAGYYNNITCLSEEVWLNEHTLVDWHLQDDSTYETLEYSDNIYTYFPDESTNRRYYYNTDHQLTSIRIIKDSDDYRDYTYSADVSIKKIIAWFDDEPYIYQPSAGWMNNENEPVTPPANANAILADAAQVFSGITIIPASSAEVIANGTCGADGDNLTWTLDSDGLLTISGTGAMTDFPDEDCPWGHLITSVVIENGVTSIGNFAFYECNDLENVTIPNSVTSIGSSAFSYCYALTDLTIPNSVISIGNYAFAWTDSLTSVTVPASVTSIGNGAFAGSTGLTAIQVADDNSNYTSIGGVLYNKSATQLIAYPCAGSVNYTIPDGVTGIGNDAFGCCYSLVCVTIPDSVTSIGNGTFSACNNLRDIYYSGTE
ncbi:MAG: leucine-rich repeat domain-containing protein, partial [Bacteroidales bacterium]|nr:leucine-rich repeat domain-containing protein [Bacteroidales bacterium]